MNNDKYNKIYNSKKRTHNNMFDKQYNNKIRKKFLSPYSKIKKIYFYNDIKSTFTIKHFLIPRKLKKSSVFNLFIVQFNHFSTLIHSSLILCIS